MINKRIAVVMMIFFIQQNIIYSKNLINNYDALSPVSNAMVNTGVVEELKTYTKRDIYDFFTWPDSLTPAANIDSVWQDTGNRKYVIVIFTVPKVQGAEYYYVAIYDAVQKKLAKHLLHSYDKKPVIQFFSEIGVLHVSYMNVARLYGYTGEKMEHNFFWDMRQGGTIEEGVDSQILLVNEEWLVIESPLSKTTGPHSFNYVTEYTVFNIYSRESKPIYVEGIPGHDLVFEITDNIMNITNKHLYATKFDEVFDLLSNPSFPNGNVSRPFSLQPLKKELAFSL